MKLADWQKLLEDHFAELRQRRSVQFGGTPLFALEHGLDSGKLLELSADVRGDVTSRRPSKEHALPWIVYAAEIGYRYAGDEYWQTLEEETPGWTVNGDRYWLRDQFRWFHKRFGAARPTGRWAEHFSIISWPITHAILPRDLQRQLARVLYELRHHFSAALFSNQTALGDLIAVRSFDCSSRFQNFAQETRLIGQIASALLLEESGSDLLLPATLKRISDDVERERTSREWLRSARTAAKERARFRGLAVARQSDTPRGTIERAREEVSALGIEPRIVLRPTDLTATAWDVFLELPDLSHLLLRFPNARGALSASRCTVAGSAGRPLARGRLLHGAELVPMARWPQQAEVLLQFEEKVPELEYLLRTECLLRPGNRWLLKVASDRLGYELREARVRAGQRYILLSNSPISAGETAKTVKLSCEGVHGLLIDVPPAVSPGYAEWLKALGVTQAVDIHVWPAGLTSSRWDGAGQGEWLASEQPCIGIRADHELEVVKTKLDSSDDSILEIRHVPAGEAIFLELPSLSVGTHTLFVSAQIAKQDQEELRGQLDLVIRSPRAWNPRAAASGVLQLDLDPPTPTLEDVWEDRVDISLRGPAGRSVVCNVSLFSKGKDVPILQKRLPPLLLPVTRAKWTEHFNKHFRKLAAAPNAYDASRFCEIEFNAHELGTYAISCERAFTPLRWVIRKTGDNQSIMLIDDSGADAKPTAALFSFESPDVEQSLDPATIFNPFPAESAGGMYVARQVDFTAAVILPPTSLRDLADLVCSPQVADRDRSIQSAVRVIRLIDLWAGARVAGALLSQTRRREVLFALVRHLFFILGGERWKRAELADAEVWLSELKHAVTDKREEAGLAAALVLETDALATKPIVERVARLAELARSFLLMRSARNISVAREPAGTLAAARSSDTAWLCEFALRIASEPHRASLWAGTESDPALRALSEKPALARAARLLVLAIDRRLESDRVAAEGTLYRSWRWE